MTAIEAAKILGVTQPTVSAWCREGKMKHTKVKSRGRTGYAVDISQETVREFLLKNGSKKTEQEEKKSEEEKIDEQKKQAAKSPEVKKNFKQVEDYAESGEDEPRKIVGDRNLGRFEAERIIKQEEAIKKQRENLLRDKEIVERAVVFEALRLHYGELNKLWEELIDIWSLKYNFSATTTKEMLTDTRIGLTRFERKMKRSIENADG